MLCYFIFISEAFQIMLVQQELLKEKHLFSKYRRTYLSVAKIWHKRIKQITKQGIAQPSLSFGNEISLHSYRPFFLTWECPFLASFLQAVVSCSFEFNMLVLGEDFIFLSFLVSFFLWGILLLSPSPFFTIKSFTTWRENKWFWVHSARCQLPFVFYAINQSTIRWSISSNQLVMS